MKDWLYWAARAYHVRNMWVHAGLAPHSPKWCFNKTCSVYWRRRVWDNASYQALMKRKPAE